jgi:polyisoprenoid-binding protein YceI
MDPRTLRGLALGVGLALALAAGAAAGLSDLARRHRIVPLEEPAAARGPEAAALLAEDLALVREDLAALSRALSEELPRIAAAAERGARGAEAERARELAALHADLARIELALAAREERQVAPALAEREPEPAEAEPPVAVAAPAAEPAPAPARSFLAFELPSQAFSFERAQRFALVPALSRVGFDARSTLHDFSGVASGVEGAFEVALARPEEGCTGLVRVRGAALATGEEGRDEGLREGLESARHPELTFRWTGFEADSVDAAALALSGTVRGELEVRGVSRPFAMPVRATVDASRRVRVEGEAPLDLRDFGVPVPSKLGLISMEPEVRVWIALVARVEGAALELERAH